MASTKTKFEWKTTIATLVGIIIGTTGSFVLSWTNMNMVHDEKLWDLKFQLFGEFVVVSTERFALFYSVTVDTQLISLWFDDIISISNRSIVIFDSKLMPIIYSQLAEEIGKKPFELRGDREKRVNKLFTQFWKEMYNEIK